MIELAKTTTKMDATSWVALFTVVWVFGGLVSGFVAWCLQDDSTVDLSDGEIFSIGVLWPFVLVAGLIWCGEKVIGICGRLIGIGNRKAR